MKDLSTQQGREMYIIELLENILKGVTRTKYVEIAEFMEKNNI